MILCEKCSEYMPKFCDGMYKCKICGKKSFVANIDAPIKMLKEPCAYCAEEKGICQKCGCNLKTEETLYYCQGCGKDKPLEEMEEDPTKIIMPGLCKECNKLISICNPKTEE